MSKMHDKQFKTLAPQRSLRSDFTERALTNAVRAKRRANNKQELITFFKEFSFMKPIKSMRTIQDVVLAVAIVATSSAGAYALTNWFGGNVAVTQNDPTVFSVDLSTCKGNMPPGVDSSNRQNVQFKILGSDHISADDLQKRLLEQCELDAVKDFYGKQSTLQNSNLYSGVVESIGDTDAVFSYIWGGQKLEVSLKFASDITVYNQGQKAELQNINVGDTVVFATQQPDNWQENTNPLTATSEVQSIYKTQYNTEQAPDASKNGFYEDSNIMPLDLYKQIQK